MERALAALVRGKAPAVVRLNEHANANGFPNEVEHENENEIVNVNPNESANV